MANAPTGGSPFDFQANPDAVEGVDYIDGYHTIRAFDIMDGQLLNFFKLERALRNLLRCSNYFPCLHAGRVNGLRFSIDTSGNVVVTDSDETTYTLALTTADHGTLTGLGDDDHIIYIKADGSRAFTGAQAVVETEGTNPGLTTTADATTGIRLDGTNGIISMIIGGTAELVIAEGKVTIRGLLDPTGLELTAVAANPGGTAANTLWLNSTDADRLYHGSVLVGEISGSPVNGNLLVWDTTLKQIADSGSAVSDFAAAAHSHADYLEIANDLSDVSSAANARNNILPSKTSNALKVLRVNAGETDYELATISGSGDVVGPSSATDNAIARFDTATGKLIQNSGLTITDVVGAAMDIATPNAAGTGTAVTIKAGATSDASGSTGGALNLRSGNGSLASGVGGALYIDTGSGGSSGGAMTLGTTYASAITVGRSGITNTLNGNVFMTNMVSQGTAGANTSNATTGVTTGIAFALATGEYIITIVTRLTSAATTTAPRFAMQGTGGLAVGSFDLHVNMHTAATGVQASNSTALGTFSAGKTGPGATARPCTITCRVRVTTAGTITLWMRSEVAASTVTMVEGSGFAVKVA